DAVSEFADDYRTCTQQVGKSERFSKREVTEIFWSSRCDRCGREKNIIRRSDRRLNQSFRQNSSTQRNQNPRPIRVQLKRSEYSFRAASGCRCDDGNINHFLKPIRSPAEGNLQKRWYVAIALLNFPQQIGIVAEIWLINPIPREIRNYDDWNPRHRRDISR